MPQGPPRMEAGVRDLPGRHQREGPGRPGDDVPVRLRKAWRQGTLTCKELLRGGRGMGVGKSTGTGSYWKHGRFQTERLLRPVWPVG